MAPPLAIDVNYAPLSRLMLSPRSFSSFFFFNDTATTEIYTLSLHDALPIYGLPARPGERLLPELGNPVDAGARHRLVRSEEHTSELQSRPHLVCRLLLEKKNSLR